MHVCVRSVVGMETNILPAQFDACHLGVFTFSSPINTSAISAADGGSAAHCGPWKALFHKCVQGFLLQPPTGCAGDSLRLLPLQVPEILRAEDVPAWPACLLHVCCHACQETGFPLRCFLQRSARVFLCVPRSVKLQFPQECYKPPTLNVRTFPWHGMWLLRSTSSSKICCFVVFVHFPFSCVQYLWVWHSNKRSVWK